MAECVVPPSLMSDLTSEVPKKGSSVESNVIKVVMDFPIVKRTDINHPHEIKFIVGSDFFITVQYEDMEALDKFKKKFEVVATLDRGSNTMRGVNLFIALLSEFYVSTDSKLDYMESRLAEIESKIFSGEEKRMVFSISEVSKKMILFRQTIKSHDEILRDLRPLIETVFGRVLNDELKEIHARYFGIIRRMTSLFETLEALRDTNMALLTTKQNEIMKTLTIMAFITFPLTLFTSMFGMNTQTAPIIGQKGDFWIIVGIMTVVTMVFFTYFKYKKWV